MNRLTCLATVGAVLGAMPALAADLTSPAAPKLGSTIFDWGKPELAPTKTGARAIVFDAPTATLDQFHCHITRLNPGENTGPLHRHPQEELVIVKEGTLEVNIDGRKQTASPGAMIFFAANENENMTNTGTTPATYYVLQWFTPLTPKS
jgi:mannose-6-phosphate isomerase-like protein (cupin superfamily)